MKFDNAYCPYQQQQMVTMLLVLKAHQATRDNTHSRKTDLKNLILIFVLALLATGARADWAVKGEGNFSCPDYVDARQTNTKKLYSSISWVQGFVTGVNYQLALDEGSNSFLGQDFPPTSMVGWLETYCRENPQDYLSDAAQALVEELQPK
jgi:hypothetical protein